MNKFLLFQAVIIDTDKDKYENEMLLHIFICIPIML